MQQLDVVEKIQTLPPPLLREVEDFVDFLLVRYAGETGLNQDDYPAKHLTRLAMSGGSFDWLNNPAEDIYTDDDGEAT